MWETIPEGHCSHSRRSDYRTLTLVLTDDLQIAELNKAYRQKDRPTDVLSFLSFAEPDFGQTDYLGDMLISLDTAAVQAQQFSVSYLSELQRLTVHGLLHLLGFEHEHVTSETSELMFNFQDELIRRFC